MKGERQVDRELFQETPYLRLEHAQKCSPDILADSIDKHT